MCIDLNECKSERERSIIVFELEKYLSKGIKVFGLGDGEKLRSKFKLDKHDGTNDIVNFVVSDKVWGITSACLADLLEKSFATLGVDGVKSKYIFTSKPITDISEMENLPDDKKITEMGIDIFLNNAYRDRCLPLHELKNAK